MKTIIIFLSLVSSVFGISINESLLKVHSVLVPKLYLMDYQYKNKIKNNTIKVAIVHRKSEYKEAKVLQKQITQKYADGIQSYKVESTLVHYSKVDKLQANIYYLFPSKKSDIKKAIEKANTNGALTFSYLSTDLEHGVMISVDIANKIKPILNLHAIQVSQINLRPVLIDISAIYIQNPGSRRNNLNIRGMYDYKAYWV